MENIGVFYASKTGVTKGFAEHIAGILGCKAFDIKEVEIGSLNNYKTLVLMGSSYYFGAIHEDWGSKIKLLHNVDFSSKNVAIVGVGSQERHADSFCSGVADFYDKLAFSGARFIGEVCTSDYKYTFSRLQFGNKLRGLCLDKADGDKNIDRINNWVDSIKKYL